MRSSALLVRGTLLVALRWNEPVILRAVGCRLCSSSAESSSSEDIFLVGGTAAEPMAAYSEALLAGVPVRGSTPQPVSSRRTPITHPPHTRRSPAAHPPHTHCTSTAHPPHIHRTSPHIHRTSTAHPPHIHRTSTAHAPHTHRTHTSHTQEPLPPISHGAAAPPPGFVRHSTLCHRLLLRVTSTLWRPQSAIWMTSPCARSPLSAA